LEWFQKKADPNLPRVLIFNFKPNKQVDDMMALFARCEWDLIVCCPSFVQGQNDCSWQKDLQKKWPKTRESTVVIKANLTEAVQSAAKLNQNGCQFFVTGSLYLVGAMLEYLKWDVDDL
jgi:folylpolyglutamate synthase/dihydropteroate synthase